MNVAATRTWSDKQNAIFSFAVKEESNLVVVARAGTGKTTTIVEMVIRYATAHPSARILVCAFNKSIATELQNRFTKAGVLNVECKTLHALGLKCVSAFWRGLRVDFGSGRADALTSKVCGNRVPDTVQRVISKLVTKGREICPHATEGSQLMDLAFQFECVPDEQWASMGYDVEFVCQKAVEAMEVAATDKNLAQQHGIDGADMIFLPVRNGWMMKLYDRVVVDEAQDMTVSQLELAQGSCKGYMAVVGDNRQAIYGFRGADSDSLSRLKAELNAAELPLNITYRCGKAIVREAQRLVPDFEAGPDNAEGEVLELAEAKLVETAAHGDFILSRKNAPLVRIAMSLLRSGKRARVAGRDIGAGLKAIVRKLAKGAAAQSIPAFLEKVTIWEEREIARLEAQLVSKKLKAATIQNKIDLVRDQAEMLAELAQNAISVRDFEGRIDALFSDDQSEGIIYCSSVHRAKGLEADRVFVLRGTLYCGPDAREEANIEYVAITRAKNTLVWVS